MSFDRISYRLRSLATERGKPIHLLVASELHAIAKEKGITIEQALSIAYRHVKPQTGRSVALPVLLVDESDAKPKPVSAFLHLHFFEDVSPGGHVFPSWEMLKIKLAEDFASTFQEARSAVNQLTPQEPAWPDDKTWGVRWEIRGIKAETLEGTSLGGAIAMGLLLLLRSAGVFQERHPLCRKLDGITSQTLEGKFISVRIHPDGRLTEVKGVLDEHGAGPKLEAVRGQESLLFVGSAPVKKHPELYAVESLDELLSSMRGMAHPRPRLRRWRILVWLAALLSLSGLAAWWIAEHPSDERLLRLLPAREAYSSTGQKGSGFRHVVNIRDFSDHNWATRLRPILSQIKGPYALNIGEQDQFAKDQSNFPLTDFDSLSGVTAVNLLNSHITSLRGAENLEHLLHFSNIGSAVQDVSWLTRCQKLQTLVLDSGFLQRYPASLSWPKLTTLILRVPESWDHVDVFECRHLKHLAIYGENVTYVRGLDLLENLEVLVLHTPKLDTSSNRFLPTKKTRHLTLVGCRDFNKLDLDVFPMLVELEIGDRFIKEIAGKQRAKLRELTLNQAHSVDGLDMHAYPSLKRLSVKHSPVRELKGFAAAVALEEITLEHVETTELPDIGSAASLRDLTIEDAPSLKALSLAGAHALVNLKVKATSLRFLEHLKDASALDRLEVTDSPLADVREMAQLRKLRYVNLSDTALMQLPALRGVPLETLVLDDSKIERLPELAAITCRVSIRGTSLLQSWETADLVWKQSSEGRWQFVKDDDAFYYIQPNYVRSLYYESGQEVDQNGWPYIESMPAPPSFSPHAMLLQWGLMGSVGLEGAYDYSGFGGWEAFEYETVPTPVSPFKNTFDSKDR